MIGQLLHSIVDTENEAARLIEEAQNEALKIKSDIKEEINQEKINSLKAIEDEAERRKSAVREEEERKDKEFEIKIKEELEGLSQEASSKENAIIEQLTQRLYA